MNLTDEETLALVNLLERTIREDLYPLSPEYACWRPFWTSSSSPSREASRYSRGSDTRGPPEADTGGVRPMTLGVAAAPQVRL